MAAKYTICKLFDYVSYLMSVCTHTEPSTSSIFSPTANPVSSTFKIYPPSYCCPSSLLLSPACLQYPLRYQNNLLTGFTVSTLTPFL